MKKWLFNKAEKSPLREWALNLTGWKWWLWQIGGGVLCVILFEFLLNLMGMSMLPWRW